jgi:hypothetical protein
MNMAGIDDLFKGNAWVGLAVGVGAGIVAPLLAPMVAAVGKPLAKSAVKAGILLYEKGRETIAELGEVMEDLVAEVRADLRGAEAGAGAAVVAQAEPEPETVVEPMPAEPAQS